MYQMAFYSFSIPWRLKALRSIETVRTTNPATLWVSEDLKLLKHLCNSLQSLSVKNPIRYSIMNRNIYYISSSSHVAFVFCHFQGILYTNICWNFDIPFILTVLFIAVSRFNRISYQNLLKYSLFNLVTCYLSYVFSTVIKSNIAAIYTYTNIKRSKTYSASPKW